MILTLGQVKDLQEKCREIADTVAPLFEKNKWEWAQGEIPNEVDIYKEYFCLAAGCLKDVVIPVIGEKFNNKISCGRLFVEIEVNTYEDDCDTYINYEFGVEVDHNETKFKVYPVCNRWIYRCVRVCDGAEGTLYIEGNIALFTMPSEEIFEVRDCVESGMTVEDIVNRLLFMKVSWNIFEIK